MKKTLLSIFMFVFMAFSVVLTGCSDKGLKDNPGTNELVVSNGGTTVVKGDYLYYINGYVDETLLEDDQNKFGDISFGAIYRTKLVNGDIQKDRDGFVINTECVVPKVVGFSNGGFYIIEDHIYYTTPYMNYSSDGQLQTSRLEFHRINIDGTDDELIYTTPVKQENMDWTVYRTDDKVLIAAYIDSKILIIDAERKNKVITELADTTSYAFYKEETYNAEKARSCDCQNYIYFTRAIDTSSIEYADYKGNEVCKLNVETGDITSLRIDSEYTYTIKDINKSNIYFTKQNTKISGKTLMHRKPLSSDWNIAHEVKMSNVEYENYYICDFGDDLMVNSKADGVYIVEGGVSTRVLTSTQTIVAVYDNCAYYINENKLYRFDLDGTITDGQIKVSEVTDVENTYRIANGSQIDFDGKRVYVYRTYTSALTTTADYLNYIDDSMKSRFVGKFNDDDIPLAPAQDENYEEGSDNGVEYIPHID